MKKLTALIIDDEKPGRENLNAILSAYFKDIKVVGMAEDTINARKLMNEKKPDIVFLDIELGAESGLDLLKSIHEPTFETIFVTAYEEYAVKAYRTNATDYLLKPIDIDDLKDAIQKIKAKLDAKKVISPVETISNESLATPLSDTYIKVITQDGFELISPDDIIYLKSINYYTNIVLNDSRELITTKTLKDYQKQLAGSTFFRVHNSYIINLKYLKSVISKDSFYAKLTNDVQISISRRRKDEFLSFLKNLSGKITKF
jgi:two-component system, LytTR family, response regulator